MECNARKQCVLIGKSEFGCEAEKGEKKKERRDKLFYIFFTNSTY